MSHPEQIVVIGGGISGLACAYRLGQLGTPVVLLEGEQCPGGLIGTVRKNGFLWESGPQSFQGTKTLIDLVRELGIESELCKADPRAPRFAVRGGRLRKIPLSPQAVLTSSLLGLGARWKVLSEALGKTKPPGEDESIAQFVRRKFGHEILEYLVAPFVSGVYAGDPERLSLRAAFPTLEQWERQYGSVLRGAMKSRRASSASGAPPPLCSFARGMATLTQALFAKLGDQARSAAPAQSVARLGDGHSGARYEVRFTQGGRSQALAARTVVLATPAHVASRLLAQTAGHLAHQLSGVAYAGVAVVARAYYRQQVGAPLDGFGVVSPRSENYRTLGIVWNSSLFGGRAPDGQVVLTSFLGGATDPEAIEKPEAAIAEIAHTDAARLLGITGPPIACAVWKHPKALPQYNLGHAHVVTAIRDAERAVPGLFFVGNYLEGPSIGKCVELGFQTAEAARESVQL